MTAAYAADMTRAKAAGAQAMALVYDAADPEWKDQAQAVLWHLCTTRATFFCDDIWLTGLPIGEKARAIGTVIQNGARWGWMAKAGEMRKSVHSHGSEKPLWRSLVYGAVPPVGNPMDAPRAPLPALQSSLFAATS